jgi:hypothetical protein
VRADPKKSNLSKSRLCVHVFGGTGPDSIRREAGFTAICPKHRSIRIGSMSELSCFRQMSIKVAETKLFRSHNGILRDYSPENT